MNVSVIIVNYKVGDKVIRCVNSINENTQKVSYEIIVVDNSKENKLRDGLKKFKNVKYIDAKGNLGFGKGNNLGASKATGKYLLFLNPDTEVKKDAINILFDFLENKSHAGIVSPLILQRSGEPLDRQGYKELNLLNGIFTFSWLRKKFPKLGVSQYYSLKEWNKKPVLKVKTVYGAALMILKETFDKVLGFDEDFFLYFEENDLSKRVRKLGLDLYINSNSKIIHEVGKSTEQLTTRDKYFERSRFLYYKKHFGIVKALVLETILKISKVHLLLALTILIGIFLRFLNLQNGMPFIGDQGWFYISARDMLLNGKIPFVGITSSHTWLHQGPIWTYMLSVVLVIFKFNPFSGAYLTILFGLLSTILIFKVGQEMFSIKVGLFSSLLYSVSPLIVFSDRMPFDPSLIPFFALVYFYSIYKWVRGSKAYFPLIIFCIVILYNLELATFSLAFFFLAIFIFGWFRKKEWFINIKKKRVLFISLLAFVVPMLPVLIYDVFNGFKQTVVFVGWILYKPLSFLFVRHAATGQFEVYKFIEYILNSISGLIYSQSTYVALILFILSVLYLIIKFKKSRNLSIGLLLSLLFLEYAGIIVNKTASDAYLPILFPFVILTFAVFLDFVTLKGKIGYLVFIVVIAVNIYAAILKDNSYNEFKLRQDAVNKIISLSNGEKYNLVGKGVNSQYESFLSNYEYLLWWEGHPMSNTPQKIKIFIEETQNQIIVYKKVI